MLKIFNFGREKNDISEEFDRIEQETEGAGFQQTVKEDKIQCNCCREYKIIKIEKDYSNDGESILPSPKVEYENGSNINGVNICNDCFSECVTAKEKQILWIKGQLNILSDEAQKLKDKRSSLLSEAETVTSNLFQIDELIKCYNDALKSRETEEETQE